MALIDCTPALQSASSPMATVMQLRLLVYNQGRTSTLKETMNVWHRMLHFLLLAYVSNVAAQGADVQSAPMTNASEPVAADLSQRAQALAARVKKELVFLRGGTFMMGDWGNAEGLPYDGFSEGNSRPLHKVTLDSFSMMAYKVTYDDFDLFTDTVGEQRVNADSFWAEDRAPRKPAGVNWFGAKAYCEWLGKLTDLPFDLPTEAQWEYAARSGGKKVLFATDNGKIEYDRNYPDDWHLKDDRTPDIGSYPPNPAGLYGMLDHRANEWTQDWYDPNYYKVSPLKNPKGPSEGKPANPIRPERGPAKVVRGSFGGGNPAMGGFVFSRAGREPRYTVVGHDSPRPGYSGMASTQFRCAVNLPKSVR
jgi:sulfatase modifying factor 1